MQTFITCRDVMNQRYEIVDGLTTVADALKIMVEKNYRKVIINRRDHSDEFGMVELSDIARKVIGQNKSLERVNVYEIMSKPVISVRPEMNIKYCSRLFDTYNLRSAPVIENEELIGVVSYDDIVMNWIKLL
ncbi:CBS domain-containing protein [Gynuella sunshinyii]|uniref:Putative transcriptional regulator, contains C-terminal CBS domain n=2 Tax=Gynuella TaxID=1445504 RepID=A0A0C5VAE4_9GAMM|nr:CBS domain-containing protein [Gynuella sunshinyii]AJQ96285.1 putative transcriptional regulator, contains C-terminal CBS domain [Gynuella sunshinyii YC6258]